MSTPESPSLIAFAASKKQRVCRVCDLPELAEIVEARKQGVPYPRIVEWLNEVRGYEKGFITMGRVERHFQDNHDG